MQCSLTSVKCVGTQNQAKHNVNQPSAVFGSVNKSMKLYSSYYALFWV